jgi:O-methyltransferase
MRAVLYAYGITDRAVWLADSFQGLPKPDPVRYPADAGADLSDVDVLAVPLEEVQANFAAYGLLDDQVRFLPGWFRDTLPTAPVERLAVLRLDGDLYESTTDALTALYPRLSPGGYVIVDDYGAMPSCREAVEDFRAERGITDEVRRIDWTGVYWQRTS